MKILIVLIALFIISGCDGIKPKPYRFKTSEGDLITHDYECVLGVLTSNYGSRANLLNKKGKPITCTEMKDDI